MNNFYAFFKKSFFLILVGIIMSLQTFGSTNSSPSNLTVSLQLTFLEESMRLDPVTGELYFGTDFIPELINSSGNFLNNFQLSKIESLSFTITMDSDCDFNIEAPGIYSAGNNTGDYYDSNSTSPNSQIFTIDDPLSFFQESRKSYDLEQGSIPNVIFEGTNHDPIMFGEEPFQASNPCGLDPIPASCCTITPRITAIIKFEGESPESLNIDVEAQSVCHQEVVFPDCTPVCWPPNDCDGTPPISGDPVNIKGTPYKPFDGQRRGDMSLAEIEIQPNPANDKFSIRIAGEEMWMGQITIENAQGQIMDNITITSPVHYANINTYQLSPGLYFVRWQNEYLFGTKKLVIIR